MYSCCANLHIKHECLVREAAAPQRCFSRLQERLRLGKSIAPSVLAAMGAETGKPPDLDSQACTAIYVFIKTDLSFAISIYSQNAGELDSSMHGSDTLQLSLEAAASSPPPPMSVQRIVSSDDHAAVVSAICFWIHTASPTVFVAKKR